MSRKSFPGRITRITSATLFVVSLGALTSCTKNDTTRNIHDMGEKVRVGGLTYTVLEAAWKNQIGDFPAARMPAQNFLLIRVSVTNSGGKQTDVPSLTLENDRGDSYPEVQDGTGITNWLGILRSINPAMTEEGWVVFDVPTNAYNLRLADPDNPDATRISFVKIPLKLE